MENETPLPDKAEENTPSNLCLWLVGPMLLFGWWFGWCEPIYLAPPLVGYNCILYPIISSIWFLIFAICFPKNRARCPPLLAVFVRLMTCGVVALFLCSFCTFTLRAGYGSCKESALPNNRVRYKCFLAIMYEMPDHGWEEFEGYQGSPFMFKVRE